MDNLQVVFFSLINSFFVCFFNILFLYLLWGWILSEKERFFFFLKKKKEEDENAINKLSYTVFLCSAALKYML